MQCKHIIGFLVLSLTFTACGRHRQAEALLMQADSLMASRPDSAYALLDSVGDEARGTWGRADRMRYELTLAEAMNKAYKDIATDSVMKLVVRYYDRHGSRNQQLKAHYLLGCAYRDMGEAPMAINAWQEAVDCADTLSTDCDYKTLYRVYGQMAELYDLQYMPHEELEAQRQVSKYALLAKDTFNYIRGIELQVNAYYLMGDSAGILQTTEKARQLYLKHGMQDEAAKVYAAAIHIAVDKGQFLLADSLMKDYVKASGLFDKKGDIEPSREQYYYYKGMCCLASGKLDSAEMLFRKLIPVSDNTMDGYLGLLKLYQEKKDIDSTVHYAQLYESALSDYLKYTHKETVTQMKALYDYSRQVKIAQLLKSRNARQTLVFVIVAFIIILGSTATFFAIRRRHSGMEISGDNRDIQTCSQRVRRKQTRGFRAKIGRRKTCQFTTYCKVQRQKSRTVKYDHCRPEEPIRQSARNVKEVRRSRG